MHNIHAPDLHVESAGHVDDPWDVVVLRCVQQHHVAALAVAQQSRHLRPGQARVSVLLYCGHTRSIGPAHTHSPGQHLHASSPQVLSDSTDVLDLLHVIREREMTLGVAVSAEIKANRVPPPPAALL